MIATRAATEGDFGIDRREFMAGLAGVAVAGWSATTAATPAAPAEPPYPPALTGLRGQYPGSFETAHAARDGQFDGAIAVSDTREHFDLVIVGAGISGLSAAYFFRRGWARTARSWDGCAGSIIDFYSDGSAREQSHSP